MPAPGSEIPSAQPADLAAAISRATVRSTRVPGRRRGGVVASAVALRAFQPSVSEAEFKKRFPLPYRVESVSLYEAVRQGWATDRSYWQFLDKFQYLSPKWGTIEVPKGFYTDFASVPPQIHSVIDDDSPDILLPSAPHDFLFTRRPGDGTRGWISKTKQLTLNEVNHVLTEAMTFCGANVLTRNVVFAAVELANQGIRNEFAH
jgi:hypothetical protein